MNRNKFNKCLLSGNTPVSMRNYFLAEKWGMAYNVLVLGEEADFEAQNCMPALSLTRSTKLHLSTEAAFLPNAC